jgi:cytochrome c biogenesis protein CcmG/thiol:disulfide interchange protein DsbE|tara:strand:+ start:4674 stop:5195 length:522 start_codon:yes stop_codon:yes gene_type:complete
MKRILYLILVLIALPTSYAEQKREMMLPDLSIKLIDGKQDRLSSLLENGPILVNFWATWCAPCKKEMIFLEEFHKKYSDQGFRVLAISTDSPKSMSKVKSYIRAKKHTFLVGLDPNQEVAKKMNAMVMPTVVLIDKDRKVSWYHQGFIPGDENEIEAQILQLLNADRTKVGDK